MLYPLSYEGTPTPEERPLESTRPLGLAAPLVRDGDSADAALEVRVTDRAVVRRERR